MYWFIYGAGMLLSAVLCGLFLGKMKSSTQYLDEPYDDGFLGGIAFLTCLVIFLWPVWFLILAVLAGYSYKWPTKEEK